MTGAGGAERAAERAGGPDPGRITSTDDLVRELDLLRRRAAYGSSKARIGLADLARMSGVPRSTVHTYVNGMRMPPADVLDKIVASLGAHGPELAAWADALDRLEQVGPAPATPDTPARTVPHDLPPPPGVFVGRTAALAALDSLGGPRRLAVLTGGGGMGKSTLALHWAHRERERFPDGQLHVDLQGFGPRPPRTAEQALAQLLRALGVEPHAIPSACDDRLDLWADQTRGRRLLVLLDNASDAAQVTPLLAPGPSVTTVVTSRDELTELVIVHDAVPVPVAPLAEADVDELVALALRDDRAGADQDAAWLPEAMRRCAGMPLALRIISERWLRGLSTSDTPRSPEELLDEMGLRSTDLGVRTTLGWTLEHLTPEARRVFRRIGAIPQAVVDERLVAAVAATPAREARLALESLAAVHLVTPVRGGFTMHDLVGAYARERYLTDEPDSARRDVEAELARHVAAIAQSVCRRLAWGEPVAEHLGGDEMTEVETARLWIERHLDTLVAVATDDTVDPRHRYLVAVVLGRQHQFFDPSLPVKAILSGAAVSARHAGADGALGIIENLLGVCCAMLDDHAGARRHMAVALRRFRRAGSTWGAQSAQTNLAKLAGRLGRHDEALLGFADLLAQELEVADSLRLSAAELLYDVRDLHATREHAQWVLDHQPTAMAHSTLPTAYHFLAQVEALTGRPDRARALLDRAPRDESLTEPMVLLDRSGARLTIAVAEDRLDEAAELGRRMLREAEASDAHGTCSALLDLADIELLRDDAEAAAVWVAEARLVAESLGLDHWTMLAMVRGVRLDHRIGDGDAARAELADLRSLATECGSTPVLDWADRLAGELEL